MIPFISHSSNDKIKEIKNRLVIVRISRWSGDRKEVGVTIKKQHKRLVKMLFISTVSMSILWL